VTIANALQLEAARATPALSRLNYDAKFDVAEPHYSDVTLTFDLEHVQRIVRDIIKLEV